MLASEIMVLVGIIFSFHVTSSYTVPQYVTSALITFVSAEVLEGNIRMIYSTVISFAGLSFSISLLVYRNPIIVYLPPLNEVVHSIGSSSSSLYIYIWHSVVRSH